MSMDLHGWSRPVSKAAVRHVLNTELAVEYKRLQNVQGLQIITGRGNRTGRMIDDFMRVTPGDPVLRPVIEDLLSYEFNIPFTVEAAGGRLDITREDLLQWFQKQNESWPNLTKGKATTLPKVPQNLLLMLWVWATFRTGDVTGTFVWKPEPELNWWRWPTELSIRDIDWFSICMSGFFLSLYISPFSLLLAGLIAVISVPYFLSIHRDELLKYLVTSPWAKSSTLSSMSTKPRAEPLVDKLAH